MNTNHTLVWVIRVIILPVFFSALLSGRHVYAQNTAKIDSLSHLLKGSQGIERLKTLNKLGWEYRNTDFTKAFTYLEEAIKIGEKMSAVQELADSYSFMGVVFKYTGDYKQALNYFFKALHLSEKYKLDESLGYSYNNIGEIQRYQKDYEAALQSSDQAVDIFAEIQNHRGLAYAYIRRGEIYQDTQNYPKALKAFLQSLEIRQKMKDEEGIATSMNRAGMIYNLMGKNQEALEYLQKALAVAEGMKDKRAIINYSIDIGKVYLSTKDYAKAILYASQGLTQAQEMQSPEYIKKASAVLQESYAGQGDFTKAYQYQNLHLAAKDSLMNDNIEKELSKMQSNFILEKKQTELNLANKDKIIQAEKLEIQQLILLVVSLGILLLFCLIGTLFYINYKRKKTNLALQERNEIIKQKSEEIETQNDNLVLLNAEITQQKEEIEAQNENLIELTHKLEIEKDQSDKLLLNILPNETALELKEKGQAKPRFYEKVTVLFADFKGFTYYAEQLPPEQLVEELNYYFSVFDNICQKYNLEKIKTIGDAYMAAGGIPVPNHSNPVDAVSAALEMQLFMQQLHLERMEAGKSALALRIGIHTGPVVAGVIGLNKFAYDIWGDAVNLAARMESSGEPNKINISGATFQYVRDSFLCTYRGKINAKNKGEVDMYFVEDFLEIKVLPDFEVLHTAKFPS
ncbi:MAG: adenylate/guanylate cyclase domain-containing protein [Microscillaceae bacterium]|nr:adenylate/guanylate cyclase domain-containing protein [Microscillaceae bacterium]